MRIALVVVMVGVAGVSQRAEACSCSNAPFAFNTSELLPRNAKLPLLGPGVAGSSFELTGADGGVVPASAVAVPGGFLVVPEQPLAPNEAFTLSNGSERRSFQTSELFDEVAPPAPTLGSFTHVLSPAVGRSTCDLGGEGFQLTVTGVAAGQTRFEVFTGATTDSIDTSSPALVIPGDPVVFLGDSSVCSARLPTSTRSQLAVQLRAVDLSGNASPLSNAVQLKSSGCSATGEGSLVVLLALLGRRLRRL